MNASVNQPHSTVASEDVLIILPVRDLVLFPGVVLPIAVSGKRALAAAQEAVRTQRRVGLVLQAETSADADSEELHRWGPPRRSFGSSRRLTVRTISLPRVRSDSRCSTT